MSYSVSGMVKDYKPSDYPQNQAIIPHGMSVVLNAPAVFAFTSSYLPKRHLEAASLLGARSENVADCEVGELLSSKLKELMKNCNIPNGLSAVGYRHEDAKSLAEGSIVQKRLVDNAPVSLDVLELEKLYENAMCYW